MRQVWTGSLRHRVAMRLRRMVKGVTGAARGTDAAVRTGPGPKASAEAAVSTTRVWPPAARRIVVHPGLPKTGTSSIQQAFQKNQAALLARGVLYPRLEISHSKPILALFHAEYAANARFQRMSADEQTAYASAARAALSAELSSPGWHTLVLSGEGISQLTGEEWQAFCAWLAPHAGNIEVVFGLRSPLDLVRSSIQQNLKSGRTLEELYDGASTFRPRQRLEAILTALPVSAITLWDFDAAVQSPEGLVRNFARCIGLDEDLAALLGAASTNANLSLSQPAVERLAARNRAQKTRVPITKAELDALSAIQGPKFQLPDAVATKARAQIAPELAWLKETFGYDLGRSTRRQGPDPAATRLAVTRSGAASGGEKPRLFLHIGMGKTGTTSIQEFCWLNRNRLAAAGVTYPVLGVVACAHHRLSPHIPPFLAKTWEFIDPEVWAPQLAAEKAQAVLLSSEIMSSADAATVRRLADCLIRVFDVRIIVYIRRIDHSIMSTFNQNVKAGTQRLPIEDALATMFDRLRVDRVLSNWIDAFGRDNLIVRLYERAQFAGGDILQDFCASIGVPWSADFVLPKGNPNSRLGREALEFKRWLNNVIPDTAISSKFNASLLDYSARQDATTKAIFQESDLLSGAVRRALIAMQEETYRELARSRPGSGGETLFQAALPADDLSWVPLDLSPGAFAEVGQAVLTPALRQILRQQIDEARALRVPQRLLYASRLADLL